jgi:hypothetical protein
MTQARRTNAGGALAVLLLAAWLSPHVLPSLLAQEGSYGTFGGYGEEAATSVPPAVVDLIQPTPTRWRRGSAAPGRASRPPTARPATAPPMTPRATPSAATAG